MDELETKSTHKCEIVPIKLEIHPSADKLSIVRVFDGYVCVVNTEQWAGKAKACYIPPDSLVDVTRPEFEFLAKDAKYFEDSSTGGHYARIKAKKLRGVYSQGLLVPVEDDAIIGEDRAEALGVAHYDPPIHTNKATGFRSGCQVEAGPSGMVAPKYDVDSFLRYAKSVFVEGEPVWVSEKIHGANSRFVFSSSEGRMYCGSRTEWKKEFDVVSYDREKLLESLLKKEMHIDPTISNETALATAQLKCEELIKKFEHMNANPQRNVWWSVLDVHPEIEKFCRENANVVLYGELYGAVQNLRYGVPVAQVRFAGFDMLKDGRWLNIEESYALAKDYEVPWVPVLIRSMPFNFDELVKLCQGNSLIEGAAHIREGVVVKPLAERWDHKVGRVQLKIVNPAYLEKE